MIINIHQLYEKFVLFAFLKRHILEEIKDYRNIEGWLSQREAIALYRFAHKLPEKSIIVEIGSWKGKSTFCLAKGAKNSTSIFAIDPFNAYGEAGSDELYKENIGQDNLLNQFTEKMRELNVIQKVIVCQGFSKDFVGKIPSIDMLFIDGDHSIQGCNFDFLNFSSVLKHGGILALHDYDGRRKDLGPTWVIENRIIPSNQYKFVGQYDSLWVCRKN